ncbi:MAG: hypothetical protein F7B06_04910, partial [Opitutae bacterium]|nr:hypothetical protein [Opitutae bacterium]
LAALFLAGVRNIQPSPVGFKFHAVLVVNSAHLASLNSPDSDRWLPIIWALDYFKSSQARDQMEGDWTLSEAEESNLPSSSEAKGLFIEAMDQWDEAKSDRAITALARSTDQRDLFNLFCHYGARDFRDIGHKAIYVANGWRTLQTIGWKHSEPVLRSLAYALLERGRGNQEQFIRLEPNSPRLVQGRNQDRSHARSFAGSSLWQLAGRQRQGNRAAQREDRSPIDLGRSVPTRRRNDDAAARHRFVACLHQHQRDSLFVSEDHF